MKPNRLKAKYVRVDRRTYRTWAEIIEEAVEALKTSEATEKYTKTWNATPEKALLGVAYIIKRLSE